MVGNRVDAERNKDRDAAQCSREPQDLVVIEEEKNVEDRIFRALGNGADAIKELGSKPDVSGLLWS